MTQNQPFPFHFLVSFDLMLTPVGKQMQSLESFENYDSYLMTFNPFDVITASELEFSVVFKLHQDGDFIMMGKS